MNEICYNLYGAIAGDIIGSFYEWNNVKTKDFLLFTESSRFTDDTVMTVATADALLHKKDYTQAYQHWGRRYPHAGYGSHFRNWLKDSDPKPYGSWGNGSAMRVSPVAYYCRNVEEVLREAANSAKVTHDHPEGIRGAQAAALAVYMAKAGADKKQIQREIEARFCYGLSNWTLDQIREDFVFDVSCQGTLPAALKAFLESADYEDAVRNAVSLGGDSDTIAAITGSIAFAFYKEIPHEILNNVNCILSDDLKELCAEFDEVCSR